MRLSLFPVGASWPEVLPRAIGSANRHWARCQHQFNHKLQGEIRGGTRASCPWPTRTPCHQALRITGSAEHLSSAMCHCTLPPALWAQGRALIFLQEEKDARIFHSVYVKVPAAVPALCRVHHMLAVREFNLVRHLCLL